ncbi:MAG: gluconate 2-dehydrogenase subunit 3 family protein [Cyclobacteriaceae bacterium]
MDRRESIKSLLVGTMAGGAIVTGCEAPAEVAATTQDVSEATGVYGRTPDEQARDLRLLQEEFFSESELDTISTLCDLILPGTDGYQAASAADVAGFIEFIAKDIKSHQLPLRGGLMWLNSFANEVFNESFVKLTTDQQKSLLDQIAYPEEADPNLSQGVKFFSLMTNLTLTGYYTSEIGVKELGFVGNTPNDWDGVPQDVLDKHGLSYEEEWLAKCVDPETRNVKAEWDEEGNLIS